MTGHCHVVDFNMLKTMKTETKKVVAVAYKSC